MGSDPLDPFPSILEGVGDPVEEHMVGDPGNTLEEMDERVPAILGR